MEWHINDLSISAHFSDTRTLQLAFEPLLRLRFTKPKSGIRIYCSRQIFTRKIDEGRTLKECIESVADRTFRSQVIRWLVNSGPFWDDERTSNDEDLFYFEEFDVTDQGLGEAARRRLAAAEAGAYSFAGAPERFCVDPIPVKQGLPELVLCEVVLPNVTSVDEIPEDQRLPPDSWPAMLGQASEQFGGLVFSNRIIAQLGPSPFHSGVARRILQLLGILNEIVGHTNADGSLDDRGMELLQMHFVGEKAWFTDESDANKSDFQEELTFPDPSSLSRSLFCSWHGKVKIGQFRIHFEWPRPERQQAIKVVYIGPKITKR